MRQRSKSWMGLLRRQPGNTDLRRDVSVMQESIGYVSEKRGDLTRALQSYHDCLAIRQELKKQEPDNIERDHDISLVLLEYRAGLFEARKLG